MKIFIKCLIIVFIFSFNALRTNSAEILQINSSNNILVGDQNRNLSIELYCSNVNEKNELNAINLLKKEFPRGNKVKIKPITIKENILIAKVFDVNETKEMSELLLKEGLIEESCQN